MLHCIVLGYIYQVYIPWYIPYIPWYQKNQNNNITSSYLYTCVGLICLNPSVPNLIISKTAQPLSVLHPLLLLSLSLSCSTCYMNQEVYIISAKCMPVMRASSGNKKTLCMVSHSTEHAETGCAAVSGIYYMYIAEVFNLYGAKAHQRSNNYQTDS